MKKFVSALALISLACVAASAQTRKNPTNDKSLPSGHIIDRIEPVAHFYDAIPTGVTVSSKGRIFVNFPRWGDQINVSDPEHPGATLISVQKRRR